MSIRVDALRWLAANHGVRNEPVYTSKLFGPEESWTKRPIWWIEIPIRQIQADRFAIIQILCQSAPDQTTFHYLRVPVSYFREQLSKLGVLASGRVWLFLSAEPETLFVDQKGNGKVEFGDFLLS